MSTDAMTPELPTVPGWYWVWNPAFTGPPIITQLHKDSAVSAITVQPALLTDGYQLTLQEVWEGPIVVPTHP